MQQKQQKPHSKNDSSHTFFLVFFQSWGAAHVETQEFHPKAYWTGHSSTSGTKSVTAVSPAMSWMGTRSSHVWLMQRVCQCGTFLCQSAEVRVYYNQKTLTSLLLLFKFYRRVWCYWDFSIRRLAWTLISLFWPFAIWFLDVAQS